MPTFIIIIFTLYLLGNIYIFLRGRQALKAQSTGVKVLLSIIFWGCASLFFLSMTIRSYELPVTFAQNCYEVGTGWLVFTLYMFLSLLFFDILRLFNRPCKYGFYLSLGLTLSLLSYGFYNYTHPDVKVINMVINKPINRNPGDSLRVVAISDVHLGYGTDKDLLKGYVNLINEQKPDLILIGGDLIDNSVVPLRFQHMEEELSQLKAPLGIYMVPGNHEYFSNLEDVIGFLKQTPIHLLRDSIVMLPNGLQIVGRDDRNNHNRQSLNELTANLDTDNPSILLDHQPYDLGATAAMGIDLQFSGHTHRGQIWPINLVTDHMFELSYGSKQIGQSQFYVSSGLSLWGPPFRIGTNSELVVFNITFK